MEGIFFSVTSSRTTSLTRPSDSRQNAWGVQLRFHGLSDTNYSIYMMTRTYIMCSAFPYYISQMIKKTAFNTLDLRRTRRRLNNPAIGPCQPWLVTTGTATTGDENSKDDKRKHVSGVILKWRMWTWGWGISHVYYVMGIRVRSLAIFSG